VTEPDVLDTDATERDAPVPEPLVRYRHPGRS